MSITTKTGDDGYTSLLGGKRVHKFDLRIELIGNLDELQGYLGLVRAELSDNKIKDEIKKIQSKISHVMGDIASVSENEFGATLEDILEIENNIKYYEALIPPMNSFIIPGDNKISSIINLARTVTRRCERSLLSVDRIYKVKDENKIYLNRLSDYLYTLVIFTKEQVEKKQTQVFNVKAGDLLLNLNLAKEIIESVEEKAKYDGTPVVIAISNEWGNIIAVHFMDDALPGSYDIAVNKAFTSSVLRLTTEEVGDLSFDNGPLYGIGRTNNNRIVTFAGGIPLIENGKVIGAIGVSGNTGKVDNELAKYGESVFKEVIR